MKSLRIASLLSLTLLTAACDPLVDVCYSCIRGDPDAVLTAEERAKVRLIGSTVRLPPSAHNVRYKEECGIDCIQWLTFEAPAADARRFAEMAFGAKLSEGAPHGLAGPNKALDWWPKALPADTLGAMNDDASKGPPYFAIAVQTRGDDARLWLRAFNT